MIGCDIIEIDRIKKTIDTSGDKFLERILTSAEIEIYKNRGNKAEFVAGRFAAKEAISKALGKGIGVSSAFIDISILPDDNGKPIVYLFNEKRIDIQVSISHSRTDAMAVCFIERDK